MKKIITNIDNFFRTALISKTFFLQLWLLLVPCSVSGTSHAHNDEHVNTQDEHQHEQETHIDLSSELAQKTGVRTEPVAAGKLRETVLLFGRVMPAPQKISHIRARFPGLIRTVKLQIGERVKAGEVIATLEANDSLQVYSIHSPIDGILIDRHANVGEFANEATLFTIADYDFLELDLAVFPLDAQHIRVGQTVNIFKADAYNSSPFSHSTITYLTPDAENFPTLTAHVPLDNRQRKLVPGLMVEAMVTVAEFEVDLRIDKRAVQQVRGKPVVFVQEGNQYQMRPVALGRSDRQFSEVLHGLHVNENYVVESSYLLKAELEKSGAAHDH